MSEPAKKLRLRLLYIFYLAYTLIISREHLCFKYHKLLLLEVGRYGKQGVLLRFRAGPFECAGCMCCVFSSLHAAHKTAVRIMSGE